MVLYDILSQIIIDVKHSDTCIFCKNMNISSIGLYSLEGVYDISKNRFDILIIRCDFGFLYYIEKEIDKVKIHGLTIYVVSNQVPLLNKISFPIYRNIKYYDLDLSLYDNQLVCEDIQNKNAIYELIKYKANNVYIVNDKPYKFSLCALDNLNDIRFMHDIMLLDYYLNHMISTENKKISFDVSLNDTRFITLPLLQINSLGDLENNIKICLNHYIPSLLTYNIWGNKLIEISFNFKFGNYCNYDVHFNLFEQYILILLSNLYPLLISIFENITVCPISINIESFDNHYSKIKGMISSLGEAKVISIKEK